MPLNKASVSKSYTSQSIWKVNNNFAVLKIREGLIRFFYSKVPSWAMVFCATLFSPWIIWMASSKIVGGAKSLVQYLLPDAP